MTIDKAIEILEDHLTHSRVIKTLDLFYALKLGIESLYVLKEHRERMAELGIGVLPGETDS